MPPVVQHGKPGSGTWASTFPENQESEADSLRFMKNFVYIAFTQIIYGRRLLPVDFFVKRRFDNNSVKMLVTKMPKVFKLADELRAAGEPLDTGFLRELHLNIFDGKRKDGKVIEVYKMGFSYGDDKHRPSVSISSNEMDRADIKYDGKEALREQTRALLVKIDNITNHLAELPETMRWQLCVFYDKKAPKGYQARTFQHRPEPYQLAEDAQSVVIGHLSANHHACQLRVSSVYIEDSMDFSAMIEGELSNIQQGLRADSKDTSMEDARNVIDSFDLPEKKTPESENSVEKGRKVKAGGGVVELEKAAEPCNANRTFDLDNLVPSKERRVKAGGGGVELEKAAQKRKIKDMSFQEEIQSKKKRNANASVEDPRNVNDSFALGGKEVSDGRREKAGGGVVELEKAAQKRNVNDSSALGGEELSPDEGRGVKAGGGVVELEKVAQKRKIDGKSTQMEMQSPKQKRNAMEKSASTSRLSRRRTLSE